MTADQLERRGQPTKYGLGLRARKIVDTGIALACNWAEDLWIRAYNRVGDLETRQGGVLSVFKWRDTHLIIVIQDSGNDSELKEAMGNGWLDTTRAVSIRVNPIGGDSIGGGSRLATEGGIFDRVGTNCDINPDPAKENLPEILVRRIEGSDKYQRLAATSS